ncbi:MULTISPECIES: recombinase family protein [unclassified Brevundimonas]|nr:MULTISPECIES: recombinase family protein [unclassified Brevundimonas]
MCQTAEYSAHVDAWVVRRIRPAAMEARPEQVDRRAAIYLRVSTGRQPASLALQRSALERYAASQAFDIVAVYEDVGKSGVTLERRSGLSRLLFDVVMGNANFAHVLVQDISRWGRFQDPDEAAHYEFVCRNHGVLVTYCRDLVSVGPPGQLAKQVKRVMAADYVRQISDRTRRGKRRAAEAGRAPGAWPRYLVDRQIIEPDGLLGRVLRCGDFRSHPLQALRLIPATGERAQVVGRIFRMFIEGGKSMADIAATLSEEGVFWTDGSHWTRRRISRILRDPLSKGLQHYGRSRTVLGVRGVEMDRGRWGEVQVFEGIVSAETFETAQARFRTLGGRSAHTDEEMVSGLRALLEKEGRLSVAMIDACPGIPSARRYISRFGTLAAAGRLVGYERSRVSRGAAPDGSPLSHEAILEGLRRLQNENGRINVSLIQADRRLPSISVITKAFGTVTAAYHAAGL